MLSASYLLSLSSFLVYKWGQSRDARALDGSFKGRKPTRLLLWHLVAVLILWLGMSLNVQCSSMQVPSMQHSVLYFFFGVLKLHLGSLDVGTTLCWRGCHHSLSSPWVSMCKAAACWPSFPTWPWLPWHHLLVLWQTAWSRGAGNSLTSANSLRYTVPSSYRVCNILHK
jgi:hypothetical protein